MIVQFNRNIQFTRLLKADGRLREFNFRKTNGLQGELFSVDVSDDRGNRLMFKMHKLEGFWKIAEQDLPDWIRENEPHFHELIEEESRPA